MVADFHSDAVRHYDVAIVGAGGAGMCLLFALAKTGLAKALSIIVIEPDDKLTNDRTWCFPAADEEFITQQLRQLIKKQWHSVAVDDHPQPLKQPYCFIHAADFYREVHQQVNLHTNIYWEKAIVLALSTHKQIAHITTSASVVTADRVFDSRGNIPPTNVLKQSFYGLFIRTQQPIDAQSFVLMDFNVPQENQTRFLYRLPFDEHHMLVELTCLSTDVMDHQAAREFLADWINQHYGQVDILEVETGIIPMTQWFQQQIQINQQIHIPIGTAAGAVKPSTGYAFKTMFYHAFSIADALKHNKPIPGIIRKPRFAFYDKLLLHILSHYPYWGKPIFKQLFKRIPCSRVLSFMEEQTTLLKEIPILMSLPFFPFLKSFAELYLQNNEKIMVTDTITNSELAGRTGTPAGRVK
jgi:lycopene beta-cyclase